MNTPDEILTILDRAAEDGVFPMLDNPYVYLAASGLTLYRSDDDWALVFEIFGFSPRAGLPDLSVVTFASRFRSRHCPPNHLAQYPNDEAQFFHPIAKSDFQDPANEAFVAIGATEVVVRDEPVRLPTLDELAQHGVAPSRSPRILVYEVCRFLAETRRDRVLATEDERRSNVPSELIEILHLDAWPHPDLAASETPSQTESFQQLAAVLTSGNSALYRPSTPPNTHWSNWPDGGRS